ncbi:unnamed protein product, partial [Owenia fusiformis]
CSKNKLLDSPKPSKCQMLQVLFQLLTGLLLLLTTVNGLLLNLSPHMISLVLITVFIVYINIMGFLVLSIINYVQVACSATSYSLRNMIYVITSFVLLIIVFTPQLCYIPNTIESLLILSGDIESHPGPHNWSTVKFLFSNINSISAQFGARFDALKTRILTEDCQVVGLCEVGTFTQDEITNRFSIPNFHPPIYSAKNRGLLIYISEEIPIIARHDFVNAEGDALFIELKLHHKSIIYGVFYRS